MADSESEGVEIEDGPPGVVIPSGAAATAAGPSTAGPGSVSRSGRPTRSAAARGGGKRTTTSSAVASIFSSSESSETATDGDDDDDEGDTDYTQTRGSDDDDDEADGSEDDSGTDAGGGGARRGRSRGRAPSYSRGASSPSRSRSPSVAFSDGGYTSGFTTGDESGDDLFDEDLDPMSLLMELEQQGAAAGTAGAAGAAGGGGAYGGGTSASALQPFELIRERRRAHRLAAAGHGHRGGGGGGGGRPGASDEDEELDAVERGTEATADVEMEDASTGPAATAATAGGGGAAPSASDAGGGGATPATGRGGRGRGRGRGGGRTPASTASGGRGRGRGSGGGGSARRRASDVFGADVDDILDDPLAERLGLTEPGSSRRRGRGRGRGRGRPKGSRRRGRPKRGLPEEVVAKLGQANVMYALRDYQPAIELLTEVIKIYPNIADPYHTLGLLHEANGQPRKALDFFMIAAHLSPKDLSLWKRLASMSTELGFYRQAVYCLTKAINRNRSDLDAMWDRAVLYAQVGDTDKALAQFAEVGRARPGDPEVPVMQARLHHQSGAPLKAIAVLEAHLRDHPGNVDLTHINILAELYMERGGYMEARALIGRAVPVLCPDQPLPLDLAVKSGLCLAHTGRWDEADEALGELLREPVEQFGDLYLGVGTALAGLGQHIKALQYLTPLLEHPDLNEPDLWTQLLRCHVALGEVAGGLELYRAQMQSLETTDSRYPAAAVSLAEMCLELGEQGRTTALEMISVLDGILDRAREAAAAAEAEAAAEEEGAGAGPSTSAAAGGAGAGAGARPPGGAGGGSLGTAAEVLGEDLAMRLSTLYLRTGLLDRYVDSIRPSVEMSLGALSNDLARVNDPALPVPLRRAILRRRMFARKGGRKGESKEEIGSVFKGATRKDRRSARTREYDRQAAEMLGLPMDTDAGASGGSGLDGSGTEGTDGGGGGSDSGGDVSGGEGRRQRGSSGPRLPRGGLIGPSVLSDPAQAQVLLQLTRALVLVGRPEEANALLDKAIALVASAGGGGGGGDGGVSLAGLANKRAGGPWFDRATIDRLRLGKLELASMMATAGMEQRPEAAATATAAAGGKAAGRKAAAGKAAGGKAAAGKAAAAATGGEAGGGGEGEILNAEQLAALRTLTMRWPYSIGLWNLYCSAHAQGTDLRSWAVQITTLRRRHPSSVPLMVLQGHVYLLARQFREAASEYFHAYRFTPEEPLLLLCLAVALLSDALGSAAAVAPGSGTGGAAQLPPQRHIRVSGGVHRDRNRGVLAGFAFLQAYQKARGGQLSQEVAYNMGRAAHQLGLLHLAHHYYEAALAAPPATGLPIWQSTVAGAAPPGGAAGHDAWGTQGSERFDLRREIAHNLVQLYRSSGAPALARSVMAKYLVV